MKIVLSGEISDLKVLGLFFAIGHEPTTKLLDGQLEVDSGGYVVMIVFAARDVQDKKYKQAVTSTGTGLSTSSISPLHYLYFDFGTSMFAPLLLSSFYLGSCVLCRE